MVKNSAATDHACFSKFKTQGNIAFGFVNFDGFRQATKLKSKHIIGKAFQRAAECNFWFEIGQSKLEL